MTSVPCRRQQGLFPHVVVGEVATMDPRSIVNHSGATFLNQLSTPRPSIRGERPDDESEENSIGFSGLVTFKHPEAVSQISLRKWPASSFEK